MSLKTNHELPLTHDASEEHLIRVQKVKKLRELGIEPWPAAKPVSATAQQILATFVDGEELTHTTAGRLMAMRGHGKTAFGVLQDRTGKIQVYFREDILGTEQFELLKNYIDLGDTLWVSGTTFRTKMGEVTLQVTAFTLLSKCLHPLPEKFHGIADIEIKYRQRYLDLMSDAHSKHTFVTRSNMIKEIRRYLESHGFMEVETPMLHPIAGGAAAKPFVTHHNALHSELFLRIAPELYLKRLVIGGFERVYEINRNFRNEGISTRHNPEFTMLEFYIAHHDYHFMMDFVEGLFRHVISKTHDTLTIPFGKYELDFSKPFTRMSVKQAVLNYGNYQEQDISAEKIDAELKKHGSKMAGMAISHAQKLFALFEEVAEPHLIQPTFIIDFPLEVSPLAKKDENNPEVVARFELFMAGMELANAFNELNDPFDQEDRFKQQVASHAAGDDEAHRFDADFIKALEHGLPPTVGCGIGIDRLAMLLTNSTSIKDVILFPTLKRKD